MRLGDWHNLFTCPLFHLYGFFLTPSPSMYNDLTPESAIECSPLRKVYICSVSTEHYVKPGDEAIVTILAWFPDLRMFVTCSLKSCANFVLQAMNAQRPVNKVLTNPASTKCFTGNCYMHLHDNLSLACSFYYSLTCACISVILHPTPPPTYYMYISFHMWWKW